MNPNQYSCNVKRLFLAHTMNYQGFNFLSSEPESDLDIYYFYIFVNDDWKIEIYLLKKAAFEFVRYGYETKHYYAYIRLKWYNLKVIFK